MPKYELYIKDLFCPPDRLGVGEGMTTWPMNFGLKPKEKGSERLLIQRVSIEKAELGVTLNGVFRKPQ